MSCPINQESLQKLKLLIDICSVNPDVLHLPDLEFFRNYIESLGGRIPPIKTQQKQQESFKSDEKDDIEIGEEALDDDAIDTDLESDLELDNEGCVEPDKLDENQKMGDSTKEVNEEDSDKADEKRIEAMSAFSEPNYEKSIELYTEAIELNPQSALLFAKRGQVYLKQNKPNACIKDCTRALELNPDSHAAYKFRGRAYRLLGEWDKSAKDLRQACNIDFDEQTDEWLKEVTPNAQKIEQHKLKLERKNYEKELRQRKERLSKGAKASSTHPPPPTFDPSSFVPPNLGGNNFGNFMEFFKDPEIMEALKDPEVSAAFLDMSSNPMNFTKYKDNPKIAALITKIYGKMGGQSGFGGAGGIPGFPSGFPTAGAGEKAGSFKTPPPQDDDNLD